MKSKKALQEPTPNWKSQGWLCLNHLCAKFWNSHISQWNTTDLKAEEGAECNFHCVLPVFPSQCQPQQRAPQMSVLAGMSQIMLICWLWLSFCCSFSSEPSSARCVPWRRGGIAGAGAHPATAGSRTGAFPWAGKGQAPGEQRADPCTRIPTLPGGGNFQTRKACLEPFEQSEGWIPRVWHLWLSLYPSDTSSSELQQFWSSGSTNTAYWELIPKWHHLATIHKK